MEKTNQNQYEIRIVNRNPNFKSVILNNALDVYNYAKQFYKDDIELYESAFIIMLNNNNKIIGWAKISQGGINMCPVDIKIVVHYAINILSSGIIFVHNHPSGNISASREDRKLSLRLQKALDIFEIRLIDCVIITNEKFLSFRSEGIIE